MNRLHVGVHRLLRDQRRAVAAAFDERHARHHRIAAERVEREDQRPAAPARESRGGAWPGSMSGLPECEMTKCSPLGVIVPFSRWCGVRACEVRGSPWGLLSVRATGFSNRDGTP